VVLLVTVAADGTVSDATVLSSVHRSLNEPARTAVRQYRYKPALRNGVPEPGKIKETVSFRFE
jgi:TonB family protein